MGWCVKNKNKKTGQAGNMNESLLFFKASKDLLGSFFYIKPSLDGQGKLLLEVGQGQ